MPLVIAQSLDKKFISKNFQPDEKWDQVLALALKDNYDTLDAIAKNHAYPYSSALAKVA